MNSPWVWIAGGFALGAIRGSFRVARLLGHEQKCRALAGSLGRQFGDSYSLPPAANSMPLFRGDFTGRNAMSAMEDESPVFLFDFATVNQVETSKGSRQRRTEGTVALLPVDGLPGFELRPRTLGWRIAQAFGLVGLTFDPANADGVTGETVRQLPRKFVLWTELPWTKATWPSGSGPSEPSEQDEAVRRLFTPAVMEVVSRYPSFAIQSSPGFLGIWTGSEILPSGRRAELWDAAVALRRGFALHAKRGEGLVVPTVPGTDAGSQARRLRNSLVGGLDGRVRRLPPLRDDNVVPYVRKWPSAGSIRRSTCCPSYFLLVRLRVRRSAPRSARDCPLAKFRRDQW